MKICVKEEMENESQSDAEIGPYKARAFNRACKAIDALPGPITSGEEAMKVWSMHLAIC